MAARKRIAARRNWPDNTYQNTQGHYWFRNPQTKLTYGLGSDQKKAFAQARAANAELERRKGEVQLIQRIDGGGDALSDWIDIYGPKQKGAPSTLASMNSYLRAFKAAPFGKHSIALITPKEIAEYLREAQVVRGETSAYAMRARLSDIFRAAIEEGRLEPGKNPVESVFKPKPVVMRERLTLDDFKAILAVSEADDPNFCWFSNAMLLALVTGQRREDIKQMQFNQVKDGFLWIEQSKGREGNKSKVRIPLDLRLDAIGMTVEDVIKRCRDKVLSKYMIHQVGRQRASVPGNPLSTAALSWAFQRMRDLAKLKTTAGKTPPSFHEIRSLTARLYTDQYSAELAQALLGHKTANMTALYRDSRGREWTEVNPKAG